MNTNSHQVAAFLGLLTVVLFGPAARAELPEHPEELLKLLKAKDAQFDNVHVYYIRRGEYTPPPFPYWKFPGMKPDEEPVKPMSFRFKEQMMLRGRESTFERDVYTKPLAPPSDSDTTFVSHQKWSDAGGLIREFLESKEYDDRSMMIKKGGSGPLGAFAGHRREVEFSLGFGFGSRIKTISSVKKKDNQLVLEGSILLWDDNVSTFRLSIDQDLVVRTAVIRVEAGGNQTRYDVTTEGSVKDHDFVFARTGHYTRTALGLKNPTGKLDVPFKPHITDEFYVDFKSVKFQLKDEEYKTFTKMEIPPGTHVTDQVKNKRYSVGKENQPGGVGPVVPGVE
jgi:hypothetical protein